MAKPEIMPIHLALNRKPREIPDLCWKWTTENLGVLHRWSARCLFLMYLGVMVFEIYMNQASALRISSAIMMLTLLYVCVIEFFIGRSVRRFNDMVAMSGHMLCVGCGYDLSGLPEEHKCPECGQDYIASELREFWIIWLAKFREPKRKKPGWRS